MRLAISEIVKKVVEAKTRQERIAILRDYNHVALRMLIKMGLDKHLVWDLPPTDPPPPYKPCQFDSQQAMLYNETKRLYIFHQGQYPTMKPAKKQAMFLEVLETVDPEDAKFLLGVVSKKLPKVINPSLINEAYPGLL